jgi:hypothetical protein
LLVLQVSGFAHPAQRRAGLVSVDNLELGPVAAAFPLGLFAPLACRLALVTLAGGGGWQLE